MSAEFCENGDVTENPEPKQQHSIEQQSVRVRRAPRFGVFMGLGAVIGALACGLTSAAVEPGTLPDGSRVDTTPVIGLMIVVGFVVGAAIGAVIAVILERTVGRRTRAAEVERLHVTAVDEPAAEEQTTASDAADPDADEPPVDSETKP